MFIDPSQTNDAVVSWRFFFDHLHLAFWFGALAFIWRSRGVLDKWADSLTTVKTKTEVVERLVMETHGLATQIKSNDLSHLAEDVKDQSVKLDKHLEVLRSIDKNMAIVADRLMLYHRDV